MGPAYVDARRVPWFVVRLLCVSGEDVQMAHGGYNGCWAHRVTPVGRLGLLPAGWRHWRWQQLFCWVREFCWQEVERQLALAWLLVALLAGGV